MSPDTTPLRTGGQPFSLTVTGQIFPGPVMDPRRGRVRADCRTTGMAKAPTPFSTGTILMEAVIAAKSESKALARAHPPTPLASTY
jgi:hypothetical protein